jgi:hypothetical protein
MNGHVSSRADKTGNDEPRPSSDRAGHDAPQDAREANENIRKAQGDDSAIGRTGNRPRFDRDR